MEQRDDVMELDDDVITTTADKVRALAGFCFVFGHLLDFFKDIWDTEQLQLSLVCIIILTVDVSTYSRFTCTKTVHLLIMIRNKLLLFFFRTVFAPSD